MNPRKTKADEQLQSPVPKKQRLKAIKDLEAKLYFVLGAKDDLVRQLQGIKEEKQMMSEVTIRLLQEQHREVEAMKSLVDAQKRQIEEMQGVIGEQGKDLAQAKSLQNFVHTKVRQGDPAAIELMRAYNYSRQPTTPAYNPKIFSNPRPDVTGEKYNPLKGPAYS